MRIVIERHELAQLINGHKMPIVRMDLADADDYGLKSEKVLIDNGSFRDGFPDLLRSEIRVYCDERKFRFRGEMVGIKSDFGYSDVMEMLDYRNAPVIKAGEEFGIAIYDSKSSVSWGVVVMKAGDRINPHCMSPLSIDEDSKALGELFLKQAGVKLIDRKWD